MGVMQMKKKVRIREKHRLCRWKITLVGVLGICLAVWYAGECISHAIWPALREVAQHECRTVVVQTIHEALRQELSNHPGRYDTLYTVEHGVIQGDSVRLNAARLSLVGAAEQALETLPDKTITIPLGALSGSIFLFDLGPGWKVHLSPKGYVEGTITEQTEPAAINRTQFTATLELTVTVNVILDGRASLASVTEELPLASFLLDGDTPTYYSSGR